MRAKRILVLAFSVLAGSLFLFTPAARAMYHPTLGRWLQRDPARYIDGANLYEAVRSSPLSARDPLGLEAEDDIAKIVGASEAEVTILRILYPEKKAHERFLATNPAPRIDLQPHTLRRYDPVNKEMEEYTVDAPPTSVDFMHDFAMVRGLKIGFTAAAEQAMDARCKEVVGKETSFIKNSQWMVITATGYEGGDEYANGPRTDTEVWVEGAGIRFTDLPPYLVAPLRWDAYWTWECGCILKRSPFDATLLWDVRVRGPEREYRTIMHTFANQAQIEAVWKRLSAEEIAAWYEAVGIMPGHLVDQRVRWK